MRSVTVHSTTHVQSNGVSTHFLQNAAAAGATAMAAATVAAAVAAAEDLRFGGCGEKFGRFWPFSDVFGSFRAKWAVVWAKLQKLLIAEIVSTWAQ